MCKYLVGLFIVLTLISAISSYSSKKVNLGYDPEIAAVAAQFAGCSCVTNEYLNEIEGWSYDHCQEAQKIEYMEDIMVVPSLPRYNLLAYVAHDKERNWNIVSFRATICGNSMANAKLDLNFGLEIYQEHGCARKQCQMHQGFKHGYNDLVRNGLLKAVNVLFNKHKSAKWLITGISLGGALVAIGAYDISQYLKDEGLQIGEVMVYTFGEPRIGNERLAQTINQELTIYRVVFEDDPIPHMPPRKCLFQNGGYFHPGIEVYYPINDSDTQKITVCAGDNINCTSNKATIEQNFSFDICDHMRYPDLDRIFQFGESQVTSTCKNNFEMGLSKQTEYISVLKFVYNTISDIINGDGQGCNPPLQTPEQLQCDEEKGKLKFVQNLHDFKWLVPDSVLEKFEGKMYPPSDQQLIERLLENFLRKKRREEKSTNKNLLLLKGIFDRKSNLDCFIKLYNILLWNILYLGELFLTYIHSKSRKRLRVLKKIALIGKGMFQKIGGIHYIFFPCLIYPPKIF